MFKRHHNYHQETALIKNSIKILSIISIGLINHAYAKDFIKVEYTPLSQKECLSYKETLGLKYCPYDNDYLAGAAKACGHIENLPTGNDLHKLAKKIYNKETTETSIYGNRNDSLMKAMNIWENDNHIYFWTGEEAKDKKGGYVRMFALKGSIPYYAPRDGSGYVSHALGKINYGETKYIKVSNQQYDSNLYGYPNNDVLVTICYK